MNLHPDPRPLADRPILIIDDDPKAIELAEHALRQAHIHHRVLRLSDGLAAIHHLQRCSDGREPMPLFIFLDLKMPGVDGFDVLDWLCHQPALRQLITVVLSTSDAPQDVSRAFELGVHAYLHKFPRVEEIKTIFQLANAMLSIEELERALWPGLKAAHGAAASR